MEPIKVYVVKTAFEHDGFSYAEGEKYELADSVVAALPEGSVELFVPAEQPAPSTDGGTATDAAMTTATSSSSPAVETPAPAQPAKPWVGGHTVGRE